MKNLIVILITLFPFCSAAQYGSNNGLLVIKEIVDGKTCETCVVTLAGSVGGNSGQVSFLTPNHDNQFLYTDSSLTTNFTTQLKSSFFVATGHFSIDFYPYKNQGPVRKSEKITLIDFSDLQFKILINNQLNKDWSNITDLGKDPDFYFGMATLEEVSDHADQPETSHAKHYFAGKFALQINDSLTVFIRDRKSETEVHHFSIKRVKSVPDYFEFIQFPASKNFEQILNSEVNRRKTDQKPPSSDIEMEYGNSGFLRFSNDEQYYFFGRTPRNSGIEYAMGDSPNDWKSLNAGYEKFTNGFTYIYLDKPAGGKTTEIFLRYKHQKESVHKVTIRVKTDPEAMPRFMYIVIGFLVILLFIAGYYFQNRRYGKKIAVLDFKKSEIENKLQLLNGQLNPHFLFNSLNAVQSLIRQNDHDAANQYITEVATFMRTIMDNNSKELVSLLEEIAMEESYIELEQKRKPFAYQLENQCSQDLDKIDFPPLLLQPIIENSIRHGFANHITNPLLTIQISCNTRDITLSISDNGTGYQPMVDTGGHGLSLIKKRIALLNEKYSPMHIHFNVRSETGKGSVTEIKLEKWLA